MDGYRRREARNCRGKEHCLVVGVGCDKQNHLFSFADKQVWGELVDVRFVWPQPHSVKKKFYLFRLGFYAERQGVLAVSITDG
jgi:hypothetical protein